MTPPMVIFSQQALATISLQGVDPLGAQFEKSFWQRAENAVLLSLVRKKRKSRHDWSNLLKGLVGGGPAGQERTPAALADLSNGEVSGPQIRLAMNKHKIRPEEVGIMRHEHGKERSRNTRIDIAPRSAPLVP